MRRLCMLIGLLAVAADVGCSPSRLHLLIVDGQSNHDCENMRRIMTQTLEETGRFAVDVVTSPPQGAPAEEWDSFRPDFAKYDVVLSNYNDYYPRGRGQPWPREVNEALEKYVREGGGLVVVHAANNAFPDWPEWNDMIGLGWRDKGFGDRIYLDDDGNVVRVPKGEDEDSSHGDLYEYRVVIRDPDHPITRGLPREWMHATDELYHAQRGPAKDMHILATAFSRKEMHGTGRHEPMMWVIPYGRGRVFTTLLGHATAQSTCAIRCVGFRTTLCRGAEWAATGNVTIRVPANFPTAGRVSTVDDPAAPVIVETR